MSTPTLVIGDIHGHMDLLEALLDQIDDRFGSDVSLFHIGDIIDRGPNSKEVVQTCIDRGIQGILGNHETWLHQWCAIGKFDSFALHPSMKGFETLKSYGVNPHGNIEAQLEERVPQSHRKYILSLPVTRKIEAEGQTYRLIHAGLKKSTALSWRGESDKLASKREYENPEDALMDVIVEKSPASILWASNSWKDPQLYPFRDGSIQIFGHSPTPHGVPLIDDHWIAIDCGCGTRRSVLGALVLGSHESIVVNELQLKGVTGDGFSDFTL